MMRPDNFCYWLQGYFELSKPEFIPPDQLVIIKAHLSMVFESGLKLNHKSPIYQFCKWVQGFFEGVDGDIISDEKTLILKDKLYRVFEHIDKQFPNVEIINKIHNPAILKVGEDNFDDWRNDDDPIFGC